MTCAKQKEEKAEAVALVRRKQGLQSRQQKTQKVAPRAAADSVRQLKIVQRCLNPGMQIVFVHDGMMERHIKSHPQHYLLLYVPGVTPENEGFLEAGANILTNHL